MWSRHRRAPRAVRRVFRTALRVGAAAAGIALGGGCAPSLPPAIRQEAIVRALLAEGAEGLEAGGASGIDRAYGAFSVAADLAPRDARVVDGLGAVAYRRGHRDHALLLFRQAIQLDPGYSRPYAHLALIAEDDGDTEAARGLLEIARQLNPMSYRARHNLALLAARTSGNPERMRCGSGEHGSERDRCPGRRFVCDELARAAATTPKRHLPKAVAAYFARCAANGDASNGDASSSDPLSGHSSSGDH